MHGTVLDLFLHQHHCDGVARCSCMGHSGSLYGVVAGLCASIRFAAPGVPINVVSPKGLVCLGREGDQVL